MDLSQNELNKMLESAVTAARLAGKRAMEELKHITMSVKYDSEVVTQADSICQQIIIDYVKKVYPGHGFIAEECVGGKLFKQAPDEGQDFWWVIDPIDGTNNYAHGMLIFTVSVAVMSGGEPIVGAIYDPATDSMYSAAKGSDARLNGRKIVVGEGGLDKFSSVSLDSNFGDSVPKWAQEIMVKTRYRNLGTTALHLAYVANGGLVAALMPSAAKLWDIAAGVLIAKAAGAAVTNLEGKELFPVDLQAYQGEGFKVLAANRTVHSEILAMLNK